MPAWIRRFAYGLRRVIKSGVSQRTVRSPESLGFPVVRLAPHPADPPMHPGSTATWARPGEPAPRTRPAACLVSVCTLGSLPFARTLVTSFARHHPGLPAMVIVADWDGTVEIDVCGATPVAAARLGIPHFEWLALKYSAIELCRAIKPYAVGEALAATGAGRIVYLDAEIWLLAPLAELLEALDSHDFVVTPHILAPPPHPERSRERPTLGDLASAGVFNAGLFGLRVNAQSQAFLRQWAEMVVAPGAFCLGQTEQNAFNWLPCFAENVHVLLNPAYNVAYWNLHDRSVRWRGLDEEAGDGWTVNGRPLVAFNFSGFTPDSPWVLSRYDHRHPLLVLPSVARLCERYAREVEIRGWTGPANAAYRFGAFPSGIPIDDRMRMLFKEHETSIACGLDPWTDAGEDYYGRALLAPIAYTGSWIPALFVPIYRSRPDLQKAFPDADSSPERFFRWIAEWGTRKYGYEKVFDRWRRVLPSRRGIAKLDEVLAATPDLVDGLAAPMGGQRTEFQSRLEEAGLGAVAAKVRRAAHEWYYHSSVAVVRRIWEERRALRGAFPDPLDADAEEFASWLGTVGVREHFLPLEAANVFRDRAQGRALARIFSYLSRDFGLMDRWPLGLVGEGTADLARMLLITSRDDLEYDAEDVMMLLWTADLQPWVGLALTLELPVNLLRQPPPILPEGQEALLRPLLARDARFRTALETYRRQYSDSIRRQEEACARTVGRGAGARAMPVVEYLTKKAGERPAAQPASPERVGRPGVNLFGYHRSPIGLGSLTRGVQAAIEKAGFPVAPNPVGTLAMDRDLAPEDFLRRWNAELDTNIFVSYPHLREMLLHSQPIYRVAGRRNIAYLAWEQQDAHPAWAEVYREFHQVWAPSSFAARSLSRALERTVLSVPCALDLDSLPEPASRADCHLPEGRFVLLYVFDANSVVGRKNPEGAIRAFSRGFKGNEPVTLVLRASHATRNEHRQRLARLIGQAPSTHDVRLLTGPLSRRRLLGLISAADCYVSLHRSEGFGVTCAEAMAYGRPVVATGYSGNLDFMDEENSYLVAWREVEVEVPDGPFQRGSLWAEPDVEHAAHLLRQIWTNPEEAKVVGERGRSAVRARLSVAAVAQVVAAALGETPAAAARRSGIGDLAATPSARR